MRSQFHLICLEKVDSEQSRRLDRSGLETEGDRTRVQTHFHISKRAAQACFYSQLAFQEFGLTPCCAHRHSKTLGSRS